MTCVVFKCGECGAKKTITEFDIRETTIPPIPFKTCRQCCRSKRDAYYRKKQRQKEELND